MVEGPYGLDNLLHMPLRIDWKKQGYDGVVESSIKKYNAQVHTQSAIHCMIELVRQNNLLAEERRSGTIETLLTLPVTEAEVVLAKWLAGVVMFWALLVPFALYLPFLYYQAKFYFDVGPVLALAIGLTTMGMMFVAIGCGLVAAFLTAKLGAGNKQEMIPVLVAAKNLDQGTKLDKPEEQFVRKPFPKESVPPEYIDDPSQFKGKSLQRSVRAGSHITMADITPRNSIELPVDPKTGIPYKAMALRVAPETIVGCLVLPGSRVDVVSVERLTNGKTVHLRTDSDAFVEEIRVLAGAGHAAKVRAELNALASAHPGDGWDATEKRLVEAGVFDG